MVKDRQNAGKPWLAALLILFLISCVPVKASADMGPKPQLIINVVNPPEGLYYLDLLIQDTNQKFRIDDTSGYDQAKIELLRNYNQEYWSAALILGTSAPLRGDLTGERNGNKVEHVFSYMGVPDDFKIIIVTPDNQLKISELIHRNSLRTELSYDYNTGKIKMESTSTSYIKQFIYTFLSTLLIEGILLLLFGFSLKLNWRAVLVVNLATQLFLTIVLGNAYSKGGIIGVYFRFLPVELIITIAEVLIYFKMLKEHSAWRRIGYAIIANAISAIAGVIIMTYQDFGFI